MVLGMGVCIKISNQNVKLFFYTEYFGNTKNSVSQFHLLLANCGGSKMSSTAEKYHVGCLLLELSIFSGVLDLAAYHWASGPDLSPSQSQAKLIRKHCFLLKPKSLSDELVRSG